MSTLDEVVETVRGAREDGPEALAAVAMAFGSSMVIGTLGNLALKAKLAELRAAQTAADEMRDALRHERDAALAELKAERESSPREEVWRLRTALDACRTERDALRACSTYEARTVAPTPQERAAHAGARWLRSTPHHVSITYLHTGVDVGDQAGVRWVPLGADGLPCAWPVVSP